MLFFLVCCFNVSVSGLKVLQTCENSKKGVFPNTEILWMVGYVINPLPAIFALALFAMYPQKVGAYQNSF